MDNDDNRVVTLEEGLITCKVCEKVFQANNCKIRITLTAYHTGNRKFILVASTIHERLAMDFVIRTKKIERL